LSPLFPAPVAIAALVLAQLPAIAEQMRMPQALFSPVLGAPQAFRVKYRYRYVPESPGSPSDRLAVDYTLTATPVREKDGYRLRLVVSEVEHPAGGGMNMVVAAALILNGLPFDMLVDERGFLTEVADWPNLQHELQRRADALSPEWRGVARSVPDNHTSQQVAWHLARAIEAMNFARSYVGFATRLGASTIKWHGGLLVDVSVQPAAAEGAFAVTWAFPSGIGVQREGAGRGVIRRDGFVAPLTATLTADHGRTQEVHVIENIAPP
jgi:hypothetical protein